MHYNFIFGLSVYINSTVERQIRDIMLHFDFQRESGGILIGSIEPLRNTITITDITYPQVSDSRLPFSFFRRQKGHQEIMDAIWENSGYEKMYLGEWHTHNTSSPIPSAKDLHEWKKCANRQQNAPITSFLIVGKMEARLWAIHDKTIHSATEVLQ